MSLLTPYVSLDFKNISTSYLQGEENHSETYCNLLIFQKEPLRLHVCSIWIQWESTALYLQILFLNLMWIPCPSPRTGSTPDLYFKCIPCLQSGGNNFQWSGYEVKNRIILRIFSLRLQLVRSSRLKTNMVGGDLAYWHMRPRVPKTAYSQSKV